MLKRLLELEPTDLFGEQAVIVSLSGHEEISSPFAFQLTIDSPNERIKPEDVIGKPLAVRIDRGDQPERYIHGYINHIFAGPSNHSLAKGGLSMRVYRVQIVPWLWFLNKASRSFVYLPEKKEKTIQEILDKLLERVQGYGHVETWHDASTASILKSRKVEHCLQYRETDFAFLTRLLARFGVYYYFTFESDKHTLVFSDQPTYPVCIESEVEFPQNLGNQIAVDRIDSWGNSYEFVSGKCEQIDYDYLKPSTSLKVHATKHDSIPLQNNKGYELYEFSNDYVEKSDGKEEVSRRLEAEEWRFSRIDGSSTCKTFLPGHTFKLTYHHANPDEADREYLLTSVSHQASQPGRSIGEGSDIQYRNQFTCIPKESQYRPVRSEAKPTIGSIQTAFVVGPDGEEIYTDEHGRVKVQFHWDREGKRDENTCCWVRVSQIHAGAGFGGIDIPRVGEEVIVSFVDGDPDRPIITGRVYNKNSMPPFPLPAQKTRSGIKTKTYKGSGFNELSMDDSPGKEQINIHAQYDMVTTVQHDDMQTIHNDRTIVVDGKHTETIKKDTTIKITEGNLNHDVMAGTATYHVKKDVVEIFDDKLSTQVKNDLTVISTDGQIHIESASKQITLLSGDSQLVLKKDGTIELKGKSITIEGTADVSISAPKVSITGKTEAKLGVSSQVVKCDPAKVTLSGSLITSSASGIHEITGALVKIN